MVAGSEAGALSLASSEPGANLYGRGKILPAEGCSGEMGAGLGCSYEGNSWEMGVPWIDK